MNPKQFPHEPCSKVKTIQLILDSQKIQNKKLSILILHRFSSQVNVSSFEDVLIFLLEKYYSGNISVAHDLMFL